MFTVIETNSPSAGSLWTKLEIPGIWKRRLWKRIVSVLCPLSIWASSQCLWLEAGWRDAAASSSSCPCHFFRGKSGWWRERAHLEGVAPWSTSVPWRGEWLHISPLHIHFYSEISQRNTTPHPPSPTSLSPLPGRWRDWSSAAFMRGNGAWLGSFNCSWGLVGGGVGEEVLGTVSSRPSKDRFISLRRDCCTFYSFSLPSVFAKTIWNANFLSHLVS